MRKGLTLLRTTTTPVLSSFFPQDCCKQYVGLVQLNQFCYSPSTMPLEISSSIILMMCVLYSTRVQVGSGYIRQIIT